MAEKLRSSIQDDSEPHLDLQPLLRLGGWGGGAIIALALAVFAGRTDSGVHRAGAAFASITGTEHQQALRTAGAELLARAEAEREARRTADAVRILAADRDRLSQRIAALERNLEDLTGSIKRQAEPPPPAAATPSSAAAAPASAALPAAVAPVLASTPLAAIGVPVGIGLPAIMATPAPSMTTASRHDEPPPRPLTLHADAAPPKEPAVASAPTAAKPPPRTPMMAMIQSYASSTALPEPEPRAEAMPAAIATSRREFAVDLGSSPTLNGLRVLWERTRARQPAHLAKLLPLVAVRDGTRPGSTELRLVVGPIVSAAAAARLCATLVVSGVPCQPAVFEGQRLAQR